MDYEIILQALWLIFPAYVANASAVLVGGGIPVDFGKNWKDGKRVFGDGKTWRGLFSGAFMGITVGFGLSVAAKYIAPTEYNIIHFENLDFMGFPLMIPIVFSLCFGALFGDIVESFFKRRIGKKRGENWYFFDQLDFIVGALLLSFFMGLVLQLFGFTSDNWFMESFSLWHILVLLVVTPFFHFFANFVHKKIKA
jgi:CDP-2,3-bis-(O-geranylgeranyl)-sn-glycerol synthase